MVEGRGWPAGNTLEPAKGQTQRWQPLLPNLQRVNAAASATGRTRFTALLHHVDVDALERAFRRQRRAASPGVDRVTMEQYEQDLEGNLQRLHARAAPVTRTIFPSSIPGMAASSLIQNEVLECGKSRARSSRRRGVEW